jgi:hypothetical protein
MPEGQRVWSIEVFHASAILDMVVGSALGDKRANELAHKPTLCAVFAIPRSRPRASRLMRPALLCQAAMDRFFVPDLGIPKPPGGAAVKEARRAPRLRGNGNFGASGAENLPFVRPQPFGRPTRSLRSE